MATKPANMTYEEAAAAPFGRLEALHALGKANIQRGQKVLIVGADPVIDYTREDFTKNGQTYDVILDTIGKSSFSRTLRSLKENGTYLNTNPGVLGNIQRRWTSKKSSKKVIPWTGGYTTNNLLALKELIEAGAIRAVIDRRYPLEQIAEAHRHVENEHTKGKVVIEIQ